MIIITERRDSHPLTTKKLSDASELMPTNQRTLRQEQSMALLPPPPSRVPLSSAELHIVASFLKYDRLTYFSFFRIYNLLPSTFL